MRNIYILLLVLMVFACKDEEKANFAVVETSSPDNVTFTTARVGGRVANDGGAEITDRGIFWGTSSGTDTTGTQLSLGTGTGVFYDTLRNLTPGVTYYVKAYAINNTGMSLGSESSFTTQISLPTLVTAEITNITPNSARLGGNITDDGGYEITARGIYWGANRNVVNGGTRVELGTGKGEFSIVVEGLSKAVTYYVMAFATNVKGTAYGNLYSFTTDPELAVVSTIDAVDIQIHSAKLGGEIKSNGGSAITERGIYFGLTPDAKTTGTKIVSTATGASFLDVNENLTAGTKYYFVAYVINSKGTSYGEEKSFTTLGKTARIDSLYCSDLTTTSMKLGVIYNPNMLETRVSIEYGLSNSYGNTSSEVTQVPSSNNDNDTISVILAGLTPLTQYYIRVKAINEIGTVYGKDTVIRTVLTGITGSAADIDGNNYNTIGIGYQTWMTENLKTTRYNDGTEINLSNSDSLWQAFNGGSYCWYDTNINYKNTYGALYNWQAVNTGKLCPAGWHVPTEEDFADLVDYLKGANQAGGLLKASGTAYWNSPNTDATDRYGFNGRGGGKRDDDGNFDFIKIEGNWWSSSNYSTLTSAYFYLMYNYPNAFQNYINKKYGLSVRCIKN